MQSSFKCDKVQKDNLHKTHNSIGSSMNVTQAGIMYWQIYECVVPNGIIVHT